VLVLIGQFAFAFTVATLYGLAAIRGDFAAWNKTLFHGYEPGNTIGTPAMFYSLPSSISAERFS
jgi:hypothetical protein